jgi:hypothetical protein
MIHIVILILRIICFATLVDKMVKKLGKTDFTLNVHVISFFKVRQGRKNK